MKTRDDVTLLKIILDLRKDPRIQASGTKQPDNIPAVWVLDEILRKYRAQQNDHTR